MAQDDVSLSIGADIAPLVVAMDKAAAAVKASTAQMASTIEGVGASLAKIQTAFLAFAAIATGGEAIKKIVKSSIDWGTENLKLAKTLGITGEQAATYQVALHHIGVDTDTVVNASLRLSKAVGANPEEFKKLHIAVRDANTGALLPMGDILPAVVARLNEMKNPTERAIEGQKLFGKAYKEILPLLKLTDEQMKHAAERAKELGLAHGYSSDEINKYKGQLADAELVAHSLQMQMGEKLLPVISQIGAAFASNAVPISNVFASALTFVAKVAINLGAGVLIVTTRIMALGRAASALAHGDLTAARAAFVQMDQDIAGINAKADAMIEKLNKPPPAADKANLNGGGPEGDDDGTKSQMAKWETLLAERKSAYEEQQRVAGSFREFDKAQELAYWKALLAQTTQGSADNLAVRRKVAEAALAIDKSAFEAELAVLKNREEAAGKNADAKLAIAKEYAAKVAVAYGMDSKQYAEAAKEIIKVEMEKQAQLREIRDASIALERTRALSSVSEARADAQLQVQLGMMTNLELLALERNLEDQKNAIEVEALDEKRRQYAAESVEYQKLTFDIEAQAIRHKDAMNAIDRQAMAEQNKTWNSIFSSINTGFQSVIGKFLQGTATIGQTIKGLFTSIASSVASTLAQVAAKNIATMLQQAAVGKTLRMQEIAGDANAGAAAAYKAVVGIPYVGPILAPIAAGAAFAGIMAFDSAEGGYDIPAGVNPKTQLHEREMVLPKTIADPLRDSLAFGGTGGGDVHNHFHLVDTDGVKRLVNNPAFTKHMRDLATRTRF